MTKSQLRQIAERRIALFCGVLAIQIFGVCVIAASVPSDAGFFGVMFFLISSIGHLFVQRGVFDFWQRYSNAPEESPQPQKDPLKPGAWKE